MIGSILLLASALSAGNAEFEEESREVAATIAVGRLTRELTATGVEDDFLKTAMLSDPARFVSRGSSETVCRDLYAGELMARYTNGVARIRRELGLPDVPTNESAPFSTPPPRFAETFARARAAACAAQAEHIALKVKPDEADLEAKGDDEARTWLTARVAYAKGLSVFEENLKYISEKIVDPILADARRERRRQQEYLMRTRCEAYAPGALAQELEANLRRNVAERKAKCDDPEKAWNVFPRVLREGIPAAVERRVMSLVTKDIDDVAVPLDAASLLATIRANPEAHRRAADSERIFRELYEKDLLSRALAKAEADAPQPERAEFAAYVQAHREAPEFRLAVEARLKREVLPKWRKVRAQVARDEADRLWPTLVNRTWCPDTGLADRLASRSDYATAVRDWRKTPELGALAQSGEKTLEESDAVADQSVSAAFDLARSAIAAQKNLVETCHPPILKAARERNKGFFGKKPNLAAVTEMLTQAVRREWSETRETTLWPTGEKPSNAAEQHVELFPSVTREIELVARQILDEMETPEPPAEAKKPEEPPPPEEQPTKESPETPEEEELCTISFRMEGRDVVVEAKRGERVVAERRAKAAAASFENALREVGGIVGREIFKFK